MLLTDDECLKILGKSQRRKAVCKINFELFDKTIWLRIRLLLGFEK